MKFFKPVFVWLVVVFCVYFLVAALPGNYMAFDENYYRVASVNTIHGVADNIEHPPLVKLMIGGAILVGGDNWVSWRLPIILCSIVSLGLVYLIGRRFLSEKLSLFATALVSLSSVFMLVGSCAILDMPTLMFGLAGVYLVLRERYGLGGLMFGLGFLCKELAVLMFLPVLVYLLVKRVDKFRLLWFGGVALCVAFFGVLFYDLAFRPLGIVNSVEHWWLMVVYQLKLNGIRAPISSQYYPPWGWVSPFGENALRPLEWISWANGWAWKAQPNVVVEYLMFPLLALLPVVYWVKRQGVALLSWLWIGASFLPWLIAGLFVKTEANFYVVYSVPFLAIGCAYLYSHVKSRKLRWGLALGQLATAVACFIYYFPISFF